MIMTDRQEREGAQTDSQHVPSFFEMLDFYDMCIQIGKCSALLLDHSEDMEVISLNSEIAAAHSTSNKEAFIVLANESGKLAKRLSDIVHQIEQDAHEMAKRSMQGVLQSRRFDKFAEALQGDIGGIRPENMQLITQTLEESKLRAKNIIGEIYSEYSTIQENRSRFLQQNKKIEIVSVYFRIEASRDEFYGAYFNNIADSLNELCSRTAASIQEMIRLDRYWHRDVTISLDYHKKGDPDVHSAVSNQLSRGNVQFAVVGHPLSYRDLLELRLDLGGEKVECQGIVRRLYKLDEDKTLVGIEFTNVDSKTYERIDAFLGQSGSEAD